MHALAVAGGRILVALVLPSITGTAGSTVLIKASDDGGATFRETARFETTGPVTSPNLSANARGGWLLLLTRPELIPPTSEGEKAQEKLSIASSVSEDGTAWSQPLTQLVQETDLPAEHPAAPRGHGRGRLRGLPVPAGDQSPLPQAQHRRRPHLGLRNPHHGQGGLLRGWARPRRFRQSAAGSRGPRRQARTGVGAFPRGLRPVTDLLLRGGRHRHGRAAERTGEPGQERTLRGTPRRRRKDTAAVCRAETRRQLVAYPGDAERSVGRHGYRGGAAPGRHRTPCRDDGRPPLRFRGGSGPAEEWKSDNNDLGTVRDSTRHLGAGPRTQAARFRTRQVREPKPGHRHVGGT